MKAQLLLKVTILIQIILLLLERCKVELIKMWPDGKIDIKTTSKINFKKNYKSEYNVIKMNINVLYILQDVDLIQLIW